MKRRKLLRRETSSYKPTTESTNDDTDDAKNHKSAAETDGKEKSSKGKINQESGAGKAKNKDVIFRSVKLTNGEEKKDDATPETETAKSTTTRKVLKVKEETNDDTKNLKQSRRKTKGVVRKDSKVINGDKDNDSKKNKTTTAAAGEKTMNHAPNKRKVKDELDCQEAQNKHGDASAATKTTTKIEIIIDEKDDSAKEDIEKIENNDVNMKEEIDNKSTTNPDTSKSATAKQRQPSSSAAGADESLILTGKRKRNTRQELSIILAMTQKRMPRKKKEIRVEDEFAQSWICAECREAECLMHPDAEALVICDGLCRRLFHWPCAGLTAIPEEDQPFYCADCTRKQHTCSICQHYGVDNEDVFCCSRKGCGRFYHESCLAMWNVDVSIKQVSTTTTNDDGKECTLTVEKRSFVCPGHCCWVCTQTDEKEQQETEIAKQKDKAETTDEADTAAPATVNSSSKRGGKGKRGSRKLTNRASGGAFDSKKERFLHRCMVCPISYHVSCLPPTCRFHELALLCHNHAPHYKLPDLEQEHSLQRRIEQEVDEKYCTLEIQRQQKLEATGENNFLPGLTGEKLSKREAALNEYLQKERGKEKSSGGESAADEADLVAGFCLPIEMKNEVEKQPPNFKQIHALKYNPGNRPPRALPQDICHCVGTCGDDCLNRLLYVECFGDCGKGATDDDDVNVNGGTSTNKSNRVTNCRVGTMCGNRQMGRRAFKKCKPERERGKGWGLVTMERIYKAELVSEYIGEVIDEKEKDRRLAEWTRDHPNDPNFYIMALSPGWYIDARHTANLSRFINHSCEPNCIMLPINVNGNMRNGVFALRDIDPGEFLSYDYHFDTRHGDRFVCRCGSAKCRGTMKGGAKSTLNIGGGGSNNNGNGSRDVGGGDNDGLFTKQHLWDEAKASYERDKRYLMESFEDEEMRRSQVSVMVPASDKTDELVANGVQQRYRPQVIQRRIFLWRTAVKGSDFDSRMQRIKSMQQKQQSKQLQNGGGR